jgi:hypothetical protein
MGIVAKLFNLLQIRPTRTSSLPTHPKQDSYSDTIPVQVPRECVGAELTFKKTIRMRESCFSDENFWDRFIAANDGFRCDEKLSVPEGIRSADYIFFKSKIIVELKSIEADPLDNNDVLLKMQNVDLDQTIMLQNEQAKEIYVAYFHKRLKKIISSANQQIRESIKVVNDPSYRGIVVVVDSAFDAIDIHEAGKCFSRILGNESTYSSLDCCIYLPSRYAILDGVETLPIGMFLGLNATEHGVRFGGAFMNSVIDFMGHNRHYGPK